MFYFAVCFVFIIQIESVPLHCGNTEYDAHNQICCCMEESDGSQTCRSHERELGLGCCGINRMSSVLNEYCCGEKMAHVCRRTTKKSHHSEWCGNERLDVKIEICCNGVKRYLRNGNLCCNTRNYNPAAKLCCDGEILSLETGLFCCGRRNFGPYYQCCDAYTGKIRIRGLCSY